MNYLKHITSLLLALLLFTVTSANATESITYIHTDHLGSPIAATNEDGSVKWTEDYQPFGIQRTNQDNDNTTGFTGHQHDGALELTYLQARWYHPEVGRFMALDPLI